MSRLVLHQHLRGAQSQLAALVAGVDPTTGGAITPLAWGELYFAEDTGHLFVGTPGVGSGAILIGETAPVNETLQLILRELRSMRLALVVLACADNRAKADDFEPELLSGPSGQSDSSPTNG